MVPGDPDTVNDVSASGALKPTRSWGIIWRMTMWGFASGGVLGGLFGTIAEPIVGTLFGLVLGSFLGLGLGLVDGLVLAVMTLLLFRRTTGTSRYRLTMSIVGALISGAGMLFLFWNWVGTDPPEVDWVTIMPALIAAAAAWWAGNRVATWVEYGSRLWI
jgi:eukaryotic-like serine/threonine-protein kinase